MNTIVSSLLEQASHVVAFALWCNSHRDGGVAQDNRHGLEEDLQDVEHNYIWADSSRDQLRKNTFDCVEENGAIHKLDDVAVPQSVKASVQEVYQFVGNEIHSWKLSHEYLGISSETSDDILCQNVYGGIDHQQTADRILRKGIVADDLLRFRLACTNCLENFIQELWPKIRNHYGEVAELDYVPFESTDVLIWVYTLSSCVEKLMKFMEYCGYRDVNIFAFQKSVEANNYVAANYFINKIDLFYIPKVVKNILEVTLKRKSVLHHRLFLMLFQHLNDGSKKYLCLTYPYAILINFLEWPLHKIFLKMAEKLLLGISGPSYQNLLEAIAQKISQYHFSQIYKEILKKFLKITPAALKRYLTSKAIFTFFPMRIFDLGQSDVSMRMIFQECNPKDRRQMLLSDCGMQTLDFLITKQRWTSIELLLHECLPSVEILEEFEANYKSHLRNMTRSTANIVNISEADEVLFFKILNDFHERRK